MSNRDGRPRVFGFSGPSVSGGINRHIRPRVLGLIIRKMDTIIMATKKEKANQEKMLKALKKLGGSATAAQLVEKTGFNKTVANETAKALVKAGKIRAVKGGKVELVEASKPAAKSAPAPAKKKSKPAPEED